MALVERGGEQRVLRCRERGVISGDALGHRPRAFEQRRVARQFGYLELLPAVLAGTDELALTPQLEVDLGEFEAVAVGLQGTQAR